MFFYHRAERRAGGETAAEPAEYLWNVGLFTRRGDGAFAGGSAPHLEGYLIHVQRNAGGDVVQQDADRRPVRFSED